MYGLFKLMPDNVELIQRKKCVTFSHKVVKERAIFKKKKIRKRVVSLDSGLAELLTYDPDQIPATFRGTGLKVNELSKAANAVSHELTLHAKAPSLRSKPHLERSCPKQKPTLFPVYHQELILKEDITPAKLSPQKMAPEKSLCSKFQTAYDVITAFANGSLQAGAELVYLNFTDNSPWNPYNLCVVPKAKADAEHYTISKFGVLHVQPDGSADLQSFAEWLREAGLFTMCSQIPFFSQYCLRRSFRCWYRNVRYNQFVSLHSKVSWVGLRFFPNFREAVENIHRLNLELQDVSFYACRPHEGYSAEVLEKITEDSRAKSHRLTQRYIKYCKRVVLGVIETTCGQAQKLEEEKQHQPFVSDLPISVQAEKHADLERRLDVARYRASRLPDFVRLAEQMVGVCLLHTARQAIRKWVEETLDLKEKKERILSTSTIDSEYTLETVDSNRLDSSQDPSDASHSTELHSSKLKTLLSVELKVGPGGTTLYIYMYMYSNM